MRLAIEFSTYGVPTSEVMLVFRVLVVHDSKDTEQCGRKANRKDCELMPGEAGGLLLRSGGGLQEHDAVDHRRHADSFQWGMPGKPPSGEGPTEEDSKYCDANEALQEGVIRQVCRDQIHTCSRAPWPTDFR